MRASKALTTQDFNQEYIQNNIFRILVCLEPCLEQAKAKNHLRLVRGLERDIAIIKECRDKINKNRIGGMYA